MSRYKLVVCGGTFDMFHAGHEDFLRFVFQQGERVIIGITSDEYAARNKSGQRVESYQIRKKAVEEYLKKEGVFDRAELVQINDLFGPTLNHNLYADALVVSEASKKGAEIITAERKRRGLVNLPIIIHNLLKTEDIVISSSAIREGIINRRGRQYEKKEWTLRTLHLPEELRDELHKPFEKILQEKELSKLLASKDIVAVGDVATKTLNSLSSGQKVSIIDFFVKREKVFSNIAEHGFRKGIRVVRAENPAGTLTPQLFSAIKKAFQSREQIVIKVEGEEDLAVLPVLIYVPLGHLVIYGQPDQGVVCIQVTEEHKEKAYSLISKFT